MKRKGIVLAGGSGTRLYPLTITVSKQLMPVYDKPMIYYPISILMLSGIKDILIITTPNDSSDFKKLLKDGSQWGVKFTYKHQEKPEGLAQALIIAEDFLNGDPSCLILGDNLFYGASLRESLIKANNVELGSVIFAYKTSNPQDYGIVEFNENFEALSLEEKPKNPRSNYAIPGIYFYDEKAPEYAKKIKPSQRGELEITDLNKVYLENNTLQVEVLNRGIAWLDTGNPDALMDASEYVKVIQHRQGLLIGCLEEIAYQNKWIDVNKLKENVKFLGKTTYAKYIKRIYE